MYDDGNNEQFHEDTLIVTVKPQYDDVYFQVNEVFCTIIHISFIKRKQNDSVTDGD